MTKEGTNDWSRKQCQNSTCSAKSSGSAGSSRRGSMARSASCAARALRAAPPGSSSAAAAVLGAASNACLGSCGIWQRPCFNAQHAGLQLVSLQAHAQATTRFAGHRELAWQRIKLPSTAIAKQLHQELAACLYSELRKVGHGLLSEVL